MALRCKLHSWSFSFPYFRDLRSLARLVFLFFRFLCRFSLSREIKNQKPVQSNLPGLCSPQLRTVVIGASALKSNAEQPTLTVLDAYIISHTFLSCISSGGAAFVVVDCAVKCLNLIVPKKTNQRHNHFRSKKKT